VTDVGVYSRAESDGPGFWAEQAGGLDWFRTWDTVLQWDLPFARWFDGGTLNVSYNCLDRHVAAGHGEKVAFHWETDDLPKTRSGMIMRRLLRDVADGRVLGDTTTLADPAVVDEIRRLASAVPTDE